MEKRKWQSDEIQVMREMYADHYTKSIAERLNRSIRSVFAQANIMGLKKSESFMKKELAIQADRLRIVGVKSRYMKGSVSHNKGKPMAAEVYEKVKSTMFKKGHIPLNTKYDGHERVTVDGYVEMRIRPGKYVLKHRHLWEQHFGKLSSDMILVFKDANPQNIQIENLEAITKKENMQRNTIHRFPPKLRSAMHSLTKLKKTIHEKQD